MRNRARMQLVEGTWLIEVEDLVGRQHRALVTGVLADAEAAADTLTARVRAQRSLIRASGADAWAALADARLLSRGARRG